MFSFKDRQPMKAGDKVTVFYSRDRDPKMVVTVVRVTKAFAQMSDGAKFQVNGSDEYPHSHQTYGGYHYCEPWLAEHDDTIRAARLRSKLSSWFGAHDRDDKLASLTKAELETLARAVREVDPTYFKPRVEKTVTP